MTLYSSFISKLQAACRHEYTYTHATYPCVLSALTKKNKFQVYMR